MQDLTISAGNRFPFSDITGGRIERSTHFHQLTTIGSVRNQIPLIIDLTEGFLKRTVQFKFEYVNAIGIASMFLSFLSTARLLRQYH